ncbi:ribonuclease P protein component [Spiroplasma endosymbiont of Aspidapion aeneum]|uniref:ribonuclease P protein component n=1 Tax=Spiroplasma endosymbiont of Aspidapion aeneum TaxID=3066276 RepID=UPI00313C153B
MKNQDIIKKNFEFQKIIQKNYSVQNACFIIFLDKKSIKFKYGISVGKKNGNAIVRNKIKRQIRTMIFEIIKLKKTKKKNLIVIVRKKYKDFSYQENFGHLLNCFNLIK